MKNILSLSFCLWSAIIFAQTTELTKNIRISFLGNVGIENMNTETINKFLVSNNFNSISKDIQTPSYISAGLTIRNATSPFITQLMFHMNNTNIYSLEKNSSIHSYGFNMNFLYDLSKNQKWLFAPLFGIRVSNYTLTAVSTNTISSLSGNLLEESFQRNYVVGLKLGADIERQIKIYNYTYSIGISAYYNLNIGKRNWYNSSGLASKNIPSIGLSEFGVLYNICYLFN